jgi:hypothetical protein
VGQLLLAGSLLRLSSRAQRAEEVLAEGRLHDLLGQPDQGLARADVQPAIPSGSSPYF